MKNNKNCRIITSALVTVLAFIVMMITVTLPAYIFYPAEGVPVEWHLGGFYLALIVLGFLLWICKTATYTVSMVKNKEENYVPKLVFEILIGFGFLCTVIAFCMPFIEGDHAYHASVNLAYIGTPLAFMSSLISNALTLKK